MNEPTIQQLTEKIDQLTREQRWYKRAMVSGLLAAVAISLLGAMQVQVHTGEMVLKDPRNPSVTRISMGANAQTGSAAVNVHDSAGRIRITIGTEIGTDKPGILLLDQQGNHVQHIKQP